MATFTYKARRLDGTSVSGTLPAENERAASTEAAALARRIAAIEAENRRLAENLSEAEAKIEALQAVERAIRGQAENDDPQ